MILSRRKPPQDRDILHATYGSDSVMPLDKFSAFMLAFSPILQHYKGVLENAGFTVLLVIFFCIVLKLLFKPQPFRVSTRCLLITAPMLLFQLYKVLRHDTGIMNICYGVFMVFFFLLLAMGAINTKYFIRYAMYIGCASGVLIIVQTISYYAIGHHIQLVPTSLLLPESSVWILGAKTGLAGITGKIGDLYRPSAFFLEPSHLFIYNFPLLCMLLLSPGMTRWRMRAAMLVTAGLVLCTSGMGIAAAVGLWGLFLVFYYDGRRRRNKPDVRNLLSFRAIFLAVACFAALVVLYLQVGFFRSAINRIFTGSFETNAIGGRMRLALDLVSGMTTREVIIGAPPLPQGTGFNMSGFFATLYKYGVTGVVLSYVLYVGGLFRLKAQYFWLSFLIVVMSVFSAHSHGTFYMLYFTVFLMNGYYAFDQSRKKRVAPETAPSTEEPSFG